MIHLLDQDGSPINLGGGSSYMVNEASTPQEIIEQICIEHGEPKGLNLTMITERVLDAYKKRRHYWLQLELVKILPEVAYNAVMMQLPEGIQYMKLKDIYWKLMEVRTHGDVSIIVTGLFQGKNLLNTLDFEMIMHREIKPGK